MKVETRFVFAHPHAEVFAGSVRKAKIVCTLGPASSSEAVIRDLLRNGMDVARLNFSHGTHEEHRRLIERVRQVCDTEQRSIAILQDLQGPKIRTGRLKYRTPVMLRKGSRVTITPRDVPGTATLLSTTFPTLAAEVRPGARILVSDGLIELRVRDLKGDDIECEVVNGGLVGEHQGINLPGVALSVSSLTEKDKKDLQFGLDHGVDLIALSFVRHGNDVRELKRLIDARNGARPVIAKLEKPQAIEHLDDILDVADGVMVARGDLGVEVPPEQVPIIQKDIIARAAQWRKPVITATQMLESMIDNPRPTRAEASDVANAIFDGSDAVMLSAETASGKYPREAVAFMARIIAEAEAHMPSGLPASISFAIPGADRKRPPRVLSIAETICESVAHAATDLEMRAIAVFTETGTTARLISKYRPKAEIYGFSNNTRTQNWMNLLWGVHPLKVEPARSGPRESHRAPRSAEEMLHTAEYSLLRRGAVAPGDVLGVVAGTSPAAGSTNFMRLHVASGPGLGQSEGKRGRGPRRRRAADVPSE